MMNARNPIFYCLAFLLVSCDKPKQAEIVPDKPAAPRRVTKTQRPPRTETTATPEELREIFKKAEKIESAQERNHALEEVVWDAMESDPQLAAEGFFKLTPGSEEKNRLIQHYAMRLVEQSLDDAIKWTATLANEQEQSLAYDNIAIVLAETEPERAAQLLSESGVAGREFDVAVVQVLQRWAAIAPAGAAGWVVLFDNGEARSAGLKAVIGAWSRTDPQGTLTWLENIQSPTIHQEAVNGMAETIMELPEAGRDDLLQLATPEIRSRLERLKTEAAEH